MATINSHSNPRGGYAYGTTRRYSARLAGMGSMGQVSAAAYSSCTAYLAANLAALPPVATAAMLLNTGSPSGSVLAALFINSLPSTPQATAQATVAQLAQEYCGFMQDQVLFGGTVPGDCTDGGTAAANAAYPSWLAYYSALPVSVWSTGMVSPAQANPQNNVLNPVTPAITAVPTGSTAPKQTSPSPAPVITGSIGNGLTPPVNTPAVTPGTVQQNQSGSGTPLGPTGQAASDSTTTAPTDIASWIQSNWAILSVAAGGIIILLSTMGSKR